MPTVVHLCFSYAAVVPGSSKPAGYAFLAELDDTVPDQISIEAAQPKLDLGDPAIESANVFAERIRNGLKHVPAERLVIAPDCGMKYVPRNDAFGKLKAMSEAAATVRKETG